MSIEAPWLKFYDGVPHSLSYPDCSMARLVLDAAEKDPKAAAYDFFGSTASYGELAAEIRLMSRSLRAIGIKPGDRVTVCMPNTPQTVIMLYAINLAGGIANMLHPLSAKEELVGYLNNSRSVAALTLDRFYPKFAEIIGRTSVKTLILTGIADGLNGIKKPLYNLLRGEKKPPSGKLAGSGTDILRYTDLLKLGRTYNGEYDARASGGEVAAILYSGGTTGTTKGILLTNLNFNALAMQTAAAGNCVVPRHKMLAIMPVFHGFGLGVCIHTALISGAVCILVPQFSIESYAKLLKKHRPHYIAGVPTLYEAMLRIRDIDKIDMSQLEGVFSGGDSLSVELKRKVDAFLLSRGASVQIREGYGLTECVTASCLTPRDYHREGSIGIPYPDTFYKIVRQDTTETMPYGELGEICLSGPTVMSGYDGNETETAAVLRKHPDGRIWLHTGDLGFIDSDGFIYFRQRIKRMIITSGYSVYPSQLENIIDSHDAVLISCVIGVPDDYRMQRIKAFVVLRTGIKPTEEIRASIIAHCERNIAKYALPRELEFRPDLPRTLVGKVAYIELEREEAAKAESGI